MRAGLVAVCSIGLTASSLSLACAATIRALPLPVNATIDTQAARAVVTATARGDVAAVTRIGNAGRIVVWDALGRRRILEPPPVAAADDMQNASTEDAVLAPDGRLYGIGAYPFSGAYSGTRTRLYVWRTGAPLQIDPQPCASGATDLHPTAVASDGRVALAGGYDSAVMNIDAIDAGGMPPTASILEGAACRVLDFGWIAALDGDFAAGHRGYQNGKPIPANVNAQSQTYIAVRWRKTHARELGPGVALGVNARGECVGSDAPPGIPGGYSVSSIGATGTVTHSYQIGEMHARLWRGQATIALSQDARRSIAYGINETGRTVVGTLVDRTGQHAVRWRDGRTELLDSVIPRDARWQLLVAYGITPDGAIYGVGLHRGSLAVFVLSV